MADTIAVAFDFDHTLGLDNKLERTVALEMLARLARERNVTYDPEAATAAMNATLASYRAGHEGVEAGIAGFLLRFIPGLGRVALDEAQDFRDLAVARAPEFVRALPETGSLLTKLDELAIPYAVLTNGWSPLQEEKTRLIGFRGSVFVSERIGESKPARAAFDVLVKHFEIPAERVWYVGDDPEADVSGAAAAGLVSVWFDWEQRTYPAELQAADYVIHALADLPALLVGRRDGAANTAG